MNTELKLNLMRPSEFLNNLFLKRKNQNPKYSTRALARDLGMSQTLLSLILNKKRELSLKQAAKISALLKLTSEESELFMQSVMDSKIPSDISLAKNKLRSVVRNKSFQNKFKIYNEIEHFQMISQWYHIAILDLTTLKNFRSDPFWIAKTLGVSTAEVRDALDRLIKLGYLSVQSDKLVKTEKNIFFQTKKSEQAIRQFHRDMIAKAMHELNETKNEKFNKREISAITIAVRADRMELAKEKIRKFQLEMASLLTEGECDELYQLNVQFFPLSKGISNKEESEAEIYENV